MRLLSENEVNEVHGGIVLMAGLLSGFTVIYLQTQGIISAAQMPVLFGLGTFLIVYSSYLFD